MLKFTDNPVLPKQDILAAYESVCPGCDVVVGYDSFLDTAQAGLNNDVCVTTVLEDGRTAILLSRNLVNRDPFLQQNILRHELIHARDITEYKQDHADERFQFGMVNQQWMRDWIDRRPKFWAEYREWFTEYSDNIVERPVVNYFESLYGLDSISTREVSHRMVNSFITGVLNEATSKGWSRKAVRPVVDQLDPAIRTRMGLEWAKKGLRRSVLADWGF